MRWASARPHLPSVRPSHTGSGLWSACATRVVMRPAVDRFL
ncbi:hypothetical protein BJ958_000471 [Nocardioides kongjuensis]|uniref:Uncharacterized protein n=1 Tax=Nocardioides kongjuensis TaxID=349522 RepID=A0A852RCC9_9ACTN|nr:hypothetical protein [Nocardioides kongjuensis]